jgi:hypothetical protein
LIPVGAVCDRAFFVEFSEKRAVIDRAYNSGGFFQRTVVVAVVAVRIVQVPAHQIIYVVAVRRALVSAIGSMGVLAAVGFAVMLRCAVGRVRVAYGNKMFINVVGVDVMQMAVMEVVDVPVMTDLHVAADSTVHVIVRRVRTAFLVLHTSSFPAGESR